MATLMVPEIIENDLHTDEITQDAITRLDLKIEPIPPRLDSCSTAHQGGNGPPFKLPYVVNSKNGINFSFKALRYGTRIDEQALPEFLRDKYVHSTGRVITKRRQTVKAKVKAKAESKPKVKASK